MPQAVSQDWIGKVGLGLTSFLHGRRAHLAVLPHPSDTAAWYVAANLPRHYSDTEYCATRDNREERTRQASWCKCTKKQGSHYSFLFVHRLCTPCARAATKQSQGQVKSVNRLADPFFPSCGGDRCPCL
ncbi:unnamed protein product [Discosporangium mesarthrocarpum]